MASMDRTHFTVKCYSEGANWTESQVLDRFANWIEYCLNRATRNLPQSTRLKWLPDLRQEAIITLLLCWRRYQSKKIKYDFTKYSYLRIRGSILDYYRDKSYRTTGIMTCKAIALDETDHDETPETKDCIGHAENQMTLSVLVSNLEQWEQNFLNLYYMQGETLKYIGGLAGVSESRACQAHARIIKRLQHEAGMMP